MFRYILIKKDSMIILENDKLNSVVVTTQEKVVGTPSYYVFKLTDKLTNNEILFIPKGLLPYGNYPDRYNVFDVELGNVDNPTSGYILNLEEGQWVYEIYSETGVAPTYSITPSYTNLCESGRALIK
jgi:hypothetical protein